MGQADASPHYTDRAAEGDAGVLAEAVDAIERAFGEDRERFRACSGQTAKSAPQASQQRGPK